MRDRDFYVKDYDPILSSKCMHIIDCHVARISKAGDKLFLLIGFRKSTKDDKDGYWCDETGKRRDWNYIEEKVVAFGKDEEELIKSTEEYKRLCGVTMIDYLEEKLGCDLSEYRENMCEYDNLSLDYNFQKITW